MPKIENKTLIRVLLGAALLVGVGVLLWSWLSTDTAPLSGGAVSVFLAALAAKAHQKEQKEIQEKLQATQKAGKAVLAEADSALKQMEDTDDTVTASSVEELTQKGNALFGDKP